VVATIGFDPQVAEAQRSPLSLHLVPPIDHQPARCAFIRRALAVGGCSRKVVLLQVFAHRAAGGKDRRQPRHAFPHPCYPGGRNTILAASIELWNYLPFQQVVKGFGFGSVPCWVGKKADCC
jgi:hypothetical protein